jgi:hypothetical protein
MAAPARARTRLAYLGLDRGGWAAAGPELKRKIKAQALERGSSELVAERISELRERRKPSKTHSLRSAPSARSRSRGAIRTNWRGSPDVTKALREASPEIQRQVFEAFELQILYDKAKPRIEISATV